MGSRRRQNDGAAIPRKRGRRVSDKNAECGLIDPPFITEGSALEQSDRGIKPGLVSLVGAGPGDPGLITVAGLERLRTADVVVYDRLAAEGLLAHARADAEMIYVGKQPGRHSLSQEAINETLVTHALRGRRVCRLKGGDPLVFGRGGEEAMACRDAGVPFEFVPGVTSAIAAPAYAGIPVTHRLVATSFAVVTGHEDPRRAETSIRWNRLANGVDTLVFLMGIENLQEITRQLIAHGRRPDTPAALVQWGTHPRQRTLVSTLEKIAAECAEQGFMPPCVTVVGEVVALREELAWFDRRPLFGTRVLVTRSRDQVSDLAALLSEQGAQVLQFPTIRIRPIPLPESPDFGERIAQEHDWVLFTSVNAVRCFFSLVREQGGDSRDVGRARIAAVGPVTAHAVEDAGLRVDLVPREATSERIVESFPGNLSGQGILVPRARIAPDDLPAALEAKGARVTVVPVYDTLPDEGAPEVRDALLAGEVDIVTFTSSSTVRNFLSLVPASEVPPALRIACIGPMTARTAREAGLRIDVVAAEHTMTGLVDAIIKLKLETVE